MVVALFALAGCGSGASLGPTANVATPEPGSTPASVPAGTDDWTTFAHDYQHTGVETQSLGISKTTVGNIKLRWSFTASDQVYASPVVTGGLVIVCTANTGIVYALSVKTGAVVWQRTLGGQIRATPTIADGRILVGTHLFTVTSTGGFDPAPSAFYSLDLVSGAVQWETPVNETIRGTAIAIGGRVIVGIAGGDPPTCDGGGVVAFDESSGTVDWYWKVNPVTNGGGAVWAPAATDGTRIIVGTGNTCNMPVTTSNATVALDPATGALQWAGLQQADSVLDDDTGGGALVMGNESYDISKDGSLYAFDNASGRIVFSEKLNPVDGSGGFATPTSDGTTIVIGAGSFGATSAAAESNSRRFFTERTRRQPLDATVSSGKILGLGLGGAIEWSVPTGAPFVSYVAIAAGMGFANIGDSVEALDLTNGNKLWSYVLDDDADGGVAIVPSGLYTASNSGTVYAFTL